MDAVVASILQALQSFLITAVGLFIAFLQALFDFVMTVLRDAGL